LGAVAASLLADASPLVRAMAVWAARRLLSGGEVRKLAARLRDAEADADVRAEWDAPAEL